MALKRSLIVGLAVLLLAAPAADARSPFHLLGTGTVWTDGDRYAVLQLDGQPVRVIDEATRLSWNVTGTPTGCFLEGAADGYLLWNCYEAPPGLQEIQTSRVTAVPGWDAYEAWVAQNTKEWTFPFGPEVAGFGSHWIRGVIGCYHCGPTYSYVDWHSGSLLKGAVADAKHVADLDDPDLDVKLCAPLRIPSTDDGTGGRYYDDGAGTTYQRPWFLRNDSRRYIQLYRCGHRKPLHIHRCQHLYACASQLGGGYLTWNDSPWGVTTIGAFRLSNRRKRTIGKLPGTGTALHTRRTVYVNIVSEEVGASGKVYAARLPRR
jgi:hypothetical protein